MRIDSADNEPELFLFFMLDLLVKFFLIKILEALFLWSVELKFGHLCAQEDIDDTVYSAVYNFRNKLYVFYFIVVKNPALRLS